MNFDVKNEKDAWELFGGRDYPNYKIFWEKFVVPRRKDTNIDLKEDLSDEEKKICWLHYSILMHFYSIYSNKDKIQQFPCLFEGFYLKLGSILDLFEQFLFFFLVYKNKLNYQILAKTPSSDKDVIKKSDNEQIIKKLKNQGNFSLPLIVRRTIIQKELKYNWKDFNRIANSIENYRNIIAHSWLLFRINNKIIKREKIDNNRDWTKVANEIANKKLKIDDFEEMNIQLIGDADKIIKIINSLEGDLIKEFIEKDEQPAKPAVFKAEIDSTNLPPQQSNENRGNGGSQQLNLRLGSEC